MHGPTVARPARAGNVNRVTGCRLSGGQGRGRRGRAEGGEEAQDHHPNAERGGSPGRRLPVAQVRAEGSQGQPPAEVKSSLGLSHSEPFIICDGAQ
jgi:hypothetical protein